MFKSLNKHQGGRPGERDTRDEIRKTRDVMFGKSNRAGESGLKTQPIPRILACKKARPKNLHCLKAYLKTKEID